MNSKVGTNLATQFIAAFFFYNPDLCIHRNKNIWSIFFSYKGQPNTIKSQSFVHVFSLVVSHPLLGGVNECMDGRIPLSRITS